MTQQLPTIGITMGDPCGIGPEIIAKALAAPELQRAANFLIFGFSELFTYAADVAELDLPWRREHHEDLKQDMAASRRNRPRPVKPGGIAVLDYDELPAPLPELHEPTHYGGRASLAFLEDAVSAAQSGLVDAIVTAPISKTAWRMAGSRFPGHTELLAKRTKTKHYAMMFASPKINIVLATIHQSLSEVLSQLNVGSIFNPIELADQALRELFGIANPRLAVAAINPHAGEDGRFGDDEKRVIAPAILMAAEAGINVTGPYPADTLFLRASKGEFDCVIAMYHDQGMIPIKLLAFREAVNLTLGLPIIRTSPPHGTAFDIAGKNIADAQPMRAAITLAIQLAQRKMQRESTGR